MTSNASFGVRFTRSWVAFYTRSLDEPVGERRRAEMASDLWEQLNDASSGRASAQVLDRCLRGIPADVWWRYRTLLESRGIRERSRGMYSNLRQNWWQALVVAQAILGPRSWRGSPSLPRSDGTGNDIPGGRLHDRTCQRHPVDRRPCEATNQPIRRVTIDPGRQPVVAADRHSAEPCRLHCNRRHRYRPMDRQPRLQCQTSRDRHRPPHKSWTIGWSNSMVLVAHHSRGARRCRVPGGPDSRTRQCVGRLRRSRALLRVAPQLGRRPSRQQPQERRLVRSAS